MNTSFLIASPDRPWSTEVAQAISEVGIDHNFALTGKECQLLIYKNPPQVVLLDFDLSNHSSLEVLKYISLSHHSIKVLLIFQNKQKLQEIKTAGFDEEFMKRMGVEKVFVRPFAPSILIQYFQEMYRPMSWKNISNSETTSEEEEARLSDTEFTRIRIEDFLSGKVSIFDYYIQLSPNRYKKIVHKGELLQVDRVNHYISMKVQYLYFQTKERQVYINFMNEVMKKMTVRADKENAARTMNLLSDVSRKMIDEVYTSGLQPALVKECMDLSQNMYNFISNDKALSEILASYEDVEPSSQTHLFLTTFFSTLICKNVEWVGEKTRLSVTIGAFLHDIGMLKLPQGLREKKPEEMTEKQLLLYKEHPRMGYDMLQGMATINEQVRQIIYQHHEFTNGSGYPNGLSGSKIYPLAKIVSLADQFAYLLISKKTTPLKGAKDFLRERENLVKFDPSLVKALIKGFSAGNEEK